MEIAVNPGLIAMENKAGLSEGNKCSDVESQRAHQFERVAPLNHPG